MSADDSGSLEIKRLIERLDPTGAKRRVLRRGEYGEAIRTLAALAIMDMAETPLSVPPTSRRYLRLFRAYGPMSARAVAALPEMAGHSRATVVSQVSDMVKRGLLRDSGKREAGKTSGGHRIRRGIVYEAADPREAL